MIGIIRFFKRLIGIKSKRRKKEDASIYPMF